MVVEGRKCRNGMKEWKEGMKGSGRKEGRNGRRKGGRKGSGRKQGRDE